MIATIGLILIVYGLMARRNYENMYQLAIKNTVLSTDILKMENQIMN
jgi:hypothetical protein